MNFFKMSKTSGLLKGPSLLIVALHAFSSSPGLAGELPAAHTVSSDAYELILENDQVLVLKMTLKPGQADKLHKHQNETVYFEKGGKLKISEHKGESFIVEVPDGHTMWHKAWAHQVSNIGSTEVVAIIVEDKS